MSVQPVLKTPATVWTVALAPFVKPVPLETDTNAYATQRTLPTLRRTDLLRAQNVRVRILVLQTVVMTRVARKSVWVLSVRVSVARLLG